MKRRMTLCAPVLAAVCFAAPAPLSQAAALLASAGSPQLAGDVTGDGRIDLSDLNLVLNHFGRESSTADTNGDGIVDLHDLNTVLADFGNEIQGTTPPSPLGRTVPTSKYILDINGDIVYDSDGTPEFAYGVNPHRRNCHVLVGESNPGGTTQVEDTHYSPSADLEARGYKKSVAMGASILRMPRISGSYPFQPMLASSTSASTVSPADAAAVTNAQIVSKFDDPFPGVFIYDGEVMGADDTSPMNAYYQQDGTSASGNSLRLSYLDQIDMSPSGQKVADRIGYYYNTRNVTDGAGNFGPAEITGLDSSNFFLNEIDFIAQPVYAGSAFSAEYEYWRDITLSGTLFQDFPGLADYLTSHSTKTIGTGTLTTNTLVSPGTRDLTTIEYASVRLAAADMQEAGPAQSEEMIWGPASDLSDILDAELEYADSEYGVVLGKGIDTLQLKDYTLSPSDITDGLFYAIAFDADDQASVSTSGDVRNLVTGLDALTPVGGATLLNAPPAGDPYTVVGPDAAKGFVDEDFPAEELADGDFTIVIWVACDKTSSTFGDGQTILGLREGGSGDARLVMGDRVSSGVNVGAVTAFNPTAFRLNQNNSGNPNPEFATQGATQIRAFGVRVDTDSGNSLIQKWINGSLSQQGTMSSPPDWEDMTYLGLGGEPNLSGGLSSTRAFDADLCEIFGLFIWNRYLSDGEMETVTNILTGPGALLEPDPSP